MKAAQFILIAIIFLTVSYSAAAQINPANISPKNSANAANQTAAGNNQPEKAQTPESVIKEIYAIHAEDIKAAAADRIVNGSDRANLDKYFDKNLADLIWNDLTMERGEDDTYEIGVIDFDLFYAAQEDESPVTNLQISQTPAFGDKATVRVNFNGGGTKETIE